MVSTELVVVVVVTVVTVSVTSCLTRDWLPSADSVTMVLHSVFTVVATVSLDVSLIS